LNKKNMPPPVPEMKVPPELWPANVFEQWPIEQIKPHSPAQRMQALGGADRPNTSSPSATT
jgi:hypothetical protein